MTSIELGELSISGLFHIVPTDDSERAFVDSATWDSPQRDASDLPNFLQHGN
jgi:hypothetical protein